MQVWLYWQSGKSHDPRWLKRKQNKGVDRAALVAGLVVTEVDVAHLGGTDWEEEPCALDLGALEGRCADETDGQCCAM